MLISVFSRNKCSSGNRKSSCDELSINFHERENFFPQWLQPTQKEWMLEASFLPGCDLICNERKISRFLLSMYRLLHWYLRASGDLILVIDKDKWYSIVLCSCTAGTSRTKFCRFLGIMFPGTAALLQCKCLQQKLIGQDVKASTFVVCQFFLLYKNKMAKLEAPTTNKKQVEGL